MTIAAEHADGCEIHFYGERGLVNALFLDLRASGAMPEFLRRIEFVFRDRTHLDLPDTTEVVVIVEAGFAEFGSPDAILVATTPDGTRLVFFLEAKAGVYRNEAQDYTKRDRGFNSTINGQFTLRYRLARALREFREDHSRLVEPQAFASAYGEQNPRRLSKPENLKHIVRPHLVGASSYFFVALTDDAANVWRGLETENPRLLPFVAEPTTGPSIPPQSDWALERNAWASHREDFGWIGFREIEALLGGGRFFRHAHQFLDAKRRVSAPGAKGRAFINIRTRPWNSYSGRPTIRLRDRLRSIIKESTPVRDGHFSYREETGSDSVIDLRNQRVLKLITPVPPYDNFDVLFGVSVDTSGFPEAFRLGSQGVIGVQNRGFEIVGISDGVFGDDTLAELVRDTLANIVDPLE
jgi:hypothetical protein